ncbi:MAG: 4-phosphoerythronate dehydrogenase [Bacteroidetes bacterium]|nr:4-phosphoerythronate dehydrogenase [Bacteroidota bacterium]MCW5895439.1 4-phosphoerythronate dehydrogenase [Bacteroidota bacterium]
MRVVVDAKLPHAATAFGLFGEVRILPTQQITRQSIADADAVLVRSETKVNGDLLDGTKVRFVGTATIGTDHVDLEYVNRHRITFASCPGSNANSVAEYVLAALLETSFMLGFTLKGKTLGVVGHGNTGSRVARKAEAIGMRVLLNDPPLARLSGDTRYLPLDALMDADVISLHVPLTKSGDDPTYHIFDERRLSAMQKGSILVNSSRGAVVDTQSLKKMIREQHVRACVLDVWEREPDIDIDMLQLALIGTPHIAGYSYDGKVNATRMLRQALGEFVHQPVAGDVVDDTGDLKEIRLSQTDPLFEAMLRSAVRECYNIEEDDRRLRHLTSLAPELRADHFRQLRANYPIRREFHNYHINPRNLPAEAAQILSAVGFSLHTKRKNHD